MTRYLPGTVAFGFDVASNDRSGRTFILTTLERGFSIPRIALVLVDSKTGKQLRSVYYPHGSMNRKGGPAVNSPAAGLIVAHDANRVFLASGTKCRLDVYDGTTAEPLGTVPDGCAGYDRMAVDPGTHRLFLSNPKRLVVVNTLARPAR